MKIAMIIPSLAQTGPGIVARDLCNEYIKKGYYCEIFYFDDKFGLETNCKTTKLNPTYKLNINDWDIIHTHGYRPDKYIYDYYKDVKYRKCKFITTLHQPISALELSKTYNIAKSLVGSIIWHKNLKAIDHIVVLNSDTYNNLPTTIQKKSSIIYNGRSFSVNEISETEKDFFLDLKSKYKIIGTASSITKRKGLEQIIKALPHLPNCVFVAVGGGKEKGELLKLAEKLCVSERCFFLGFKSNSTDYLRYFDIFVMCTRSEGFPLALIEAASQGISTVLSNIPILKAIVSEDLVNFYKLDDISSLVDSIKDALLNNKGTDLKKFYNKNLTAEIMASKYLNLYGE